MGKSLHTTGVPETQAVVFPGSASEGKRMEQSSQGTEGPLEFKEMQREQHRAVHAVGGHKKCAVLEVHVAGRELARGSSRAT